jgi:UDP-N-acetylglucosamine/UDP-N-acetylgalactosamine diphosphorylase
MSTNYDELKNKLEKYGQEHLLRFWNELNDEEKKELTESINEIDFEQLDELIKSIDKDEDTRKNIEQAEYIPFPKEEEDFYLLKEAGVTDIKGSPSFYENMREKGEDLLSKGKVAAFVVAGGQGSRLGYDAPKGFFPIGPVTEKSLFQIYFEKLKALNKKHSTEIPFLIMTSEMTHNDTIDFMKKHNYFGYNKDKVHIFQQGKMPAVDKNGKILMAEKHKPFFSPNGHGGSVFALKDSGMLDKLIKEGIEHIFYFQVDNVLVRMCEPYFLGCHIDKENELSIKVIEKAYPEEKLGVYVINNGKPFIIEYSDLSDEERYAKDESEKYAGKLKYRLGSHAIHILSLAFIKSFTSRYKNLPFHKANKKVPHINEKGEYIEPEIGRASCRERV